MIPKSKDELQSKSAVQNSPKTKRDKVKLLTYLTSLSCALTIGSLVFATASVTGSQSELAKLQAETVPVVVASQPINPGATIGAESLSVVNIPKPYTATDAIRDIEGALGKVATSPIPANGQLTATSLAGAQGATTLALALEANAVATSVSVDAQTGIAGLLRQGDFVDVLAEGAVIVENVRVLALDASLSESAGEYATVTIEVSVEQAGVIQNAQTNADVRFVLHAEANKVQASVPEVG